MKSVEQCLEKRCQPRSLQPNEELGFRSNEELTSFKADTYYNFNLSQRRWDMSSTETSVLDSTDALVKEALGEFIFQHTRQDALSAIDEIVLSYVVSILESLATESGDDAFDVDLFSEMMSAYLPGFSNINSSAICEWMFELAAWLAEQGGKPRHPFQRDRNKTDYHLTLDSSVKREHNKEALGDENNYTSDNTSVCSCSSNASQSEDEGKHSSSVSEDKLSFQTQMNLLTEMFPHICTLELQHCLNITNGDCQQAAQLLLQRQDSGEQVISKPKVGQRKAKTWKCVDNSLQDKELREQILNRYAYIDKDDDVREHKPVAPKAEPKKLIRYRDNKIVSVKGERYSEVKTEESEDMKKTYVTLKPARQYRFH